MEKNFVMPMAEIITFDNEDVILASIGSSWNGFFGDSDTNDF